MIWDFALRDPFHIYAPPVPHSTNTTWRWVTMLTNDSTDNIRKCNALSEADQQLVLRSLPQIARGWYLLTGELLPIFAVENLIIRLARRFEHLGLFLPTPAMEQTMRNLEHLDPFNTPRAQSPAREHDHADE